MQQGTTNAAAPAEPGAGDVPIMLDGEELVLRPSLEACATINKLGGESLALAVQKAARYDFEFLCDVIALGLGATSSALKKEVREKVYRTGVIHVMPDCILFIRTVMNGGVLPKDPEDEEDGQSSDPLAETTSLSENSTAA